MRPTARRGHTVAEPQPLRVLIVDDEPLGCERIRELLEGEPGIELVGVAENGDEAVEAIRALRPDLVFLDVQMPRGTGIDVVREVGPAAMPATVFVTAYDRYALQAFDFAAVDYLVKPFDDERFEEALKRARRRIELEGLDRLRGQMQSLVAGAPADGAAPLAAPPYLDRVAVSMKGRLRVVPVAEIDYITASGPYAELHVGPQRHVIRESMQKLEEQLDPGVFVRIHRSAIVRLDRIEALLRGTMGDYRVQLRGGVRLRVSRARREALERRLGRAP
jgi:two-component system, LytTR family, response regulator